MGRDGASYQDTIARLEADIAKMKVTISEVLSRVKTPPPLNLEIGMLAEHEVVHSRLGWLFGIVAQS